MKKKAKYYLLFLLIIELFSCSNSNKKAVTKEVSPLAKTYSSAVAISTEEINKDSINYFLVDNYPVTNEMLKDKTSNNSTYLRQSGNVYSLEKAWFTNDNLNQSLVFQLYTDYHRMETYHFKNDYIPESLITRMELSIAEGKSKNIFKGATNEQKIKSLRGFVNLSEHIDQKYFTTQKGIKLGDEKEKLIKQYGKPDRISKENGYDIYNWTFLGEYNLTGDLATKKTNDTYRKSVAKESFGHTVTLYFKNDKLVAQILGNDIP